MNRPIPVIKPDPCPGKTDLQGVWLDLFKLGLVDRDTRLTEDGAALLSRIVADSKGGVS